MKGSFVGGLPCLGRDGGGGIAGSRRGREEDDRKRPLARRRDSRLEPLRKAGHEVGNEKITIVLQNQGIRWPRAKGMLGCRS